ncbi:MAG: hypothetical protein K0Q99_1900 [Clostridia bacterium]|nr:hypothetical protein [Clostridia bacterium]
MFKQIYEKQITLEEIFTGSWSIFTKNFKPIFIITMLIYIPINIFMYIVGNTILDLSDFRIYLNIANLLETLFGIIVSMGIAVIVEKATYSETGEEIGWKSALSKSLSRWASGVGTSLLGGFILVLFVLLLVIPGIIWSVYYAFLIQAVVLRNVGGTDALGYSKSLVKGQWWKVFGITTLILVLQLIISFAVGFIGGFLPAILGVVTDSLIDIIEAFFTVTTTVFFINLDFVKNHYIPAELVEEATEE